MATKTKAVTWPYAMKTVAIGGMPALTSCPYSYQPPPAFNLKGAEMAFYIYPPLYIYQPAGLYMHLDYTFNSVIATADRILQGIYVRDTTNSYVGDFGSAVENYMPLNIQADVNRNIKINLDLSSLLTGRGTNVVFLRFNANCSEQLRSGGPTNGDSVNLWKLDLTYQTTGIRNEK